MNQNNNYSFDPITGQPINQQPVQNTTNMYSQQPVQPQQNFNTYQHPTQSPSSKKKINLKLLIIIAAVIIVIVAGVIFVPKLLSNKEKTNMSDSLTSSSSFWISNAEDLYALFDINGKQITEFEYTSVGSTFISGTTVVKNKNNEYGLISSTGKLLVDFGEYDYISEQNAVYRMTDNKYNDYLYNSAGKLVRQLEKNEDIISYVGEYTYVLTESDTSYKVINYNGKEIISFNVATDDDIDSPYTSSKENYVSIFYNNVNYIIDISKGKVLLTFNDSRRFCVRAVNEENSEEFILGTCNASYGEKQRAAFKLVRNGKVAYSKEAADDYALMKFEGNNVVYEDDNIYLLDENGNEKIKVNGSINYKDYKNYIREVDGILNGSELYVDGILKERLDCNNIQLGYARYGVYLLDHCSGFGNGDKIYISADGTRINDKSYKRAYEFDENGYASVSEDGKNFYLINLKGEKVSDYYSDNRTAEKIYNINETDDLYYGTNENGTTTIFDINGQKLVSVEKINIHTNIHVFNNDAYIIIENNGKYTVRDLKKEKDIVTSVSKPKTYTNYFTTLENSKTQYYSYTTGKLFYEG